MKKLFSANHQANAIDMALLIARVGIGVLMLVHGFPKLQMLLSGDPVKFPGILGMSGEVSLFLAVFAEFVCSILLIVGFATRLAVIPLIITMLVAVLYVHGSDPFAKQEMGIHYLLTYVVLLFTGSGKYSFDYLIQSKVRTTAYTSAKTNVLISQ